MRKISKSDWKLKQVGVNEWTLFFHFPTVLTKKVKNEPFLADVLKMFVVVLSVKVELPG